LALLVLLGVCWGLYYPIFKFAARSGLPSSGLIMAITGGVALALLGITLVRRRPPLFSRRTARFYLVCAILGYLVPYTFALVASSRVEAGVLTLIGATSPILTLSLASLTGTERLTLRRILSITLGATSVVILVAPQAQLAGGAALVGMLAGFAVPMSYSSYHVFVSRNWPPGFDSFQVAAGEALVALILMLPVLFFSDGLAVFTGGWTTGHWAILAMIGFTTLTCYLYFEIIRQAGPVFVSQANFVTVVAGVLWAMTLLGERPGTWLWASLLLLIASLAVLAGGAATLISLSRALKWKRVAPERSGGLSLNPSPALWSGRGWRPQRSKGRRVRACKHRC
jgi:drug/metabolite transporter (DMT)-like permease